MNINQIQTILTETKLKLTEIMKLNIGGGIVDMSLEMKLGKTMTIRDKGEADTQNPEIEAVKEKVREKEDMK